MSAVWVLQTRGRHEACQATLDACEQAGMTSRGVVYIDETWYPSLRLPRNWEAHYEQEWQSIRGGMDYIFERFPDATQYGWLADDTRPRTKRFDKLLEDAAGEHGFAYAADGWLAEDPWELDRLESGMNCSSGLCFGGELVREAGWWAPPFLRQAGIDTVWLALTRPLGLTRYVGSVLVEHLNWRTGKRDYDGGDDWTRDGDPYVEKDIAAAREWLASIEYRSLLMRLQQKTGTGSVTEALRGSFIEQLWYRNPDMLPAARLLKIQEGLYDQHIRDEVRDHDADPRPAGAAA